MQDGIHGPSLGHSTESMSKHRAASDCLLAGQVPGAAFSRAPEYVACVADEGLAQTLSGALHGLDGGSGDGTGEIGLLDHPPVL